MSLSWRATCVGNAPYRVLVSLGKRCRCLWHAWSKVELLLAGWRPNELPLTLTADRWHAALQGQSPSRGGSGSGGGAQCGRRAVAGVLVWLSAWRRSNAAASGSTAAAAATAGAQRGWLKISRASIQRSWTPDTCCAWPPKTGMILFSIHSFGYIGAYCSAQQLVWFIKQLLHSKRRHCRAGQAGTRMRAAAAVFSVPHLVRFTATLCRGGPQLRPCTVCGPQLAPV